MSYGLGKLLYPGLAEDIGELFDKYGFELSGVTTEWIPKLGCPAIQATYIVDTPLENDRIQVNFRNIYAHLTHEEYKRIRLDEAVQKKVLNNLEKQIASIIKKNAEEARKQLCNR